MGLMLEESSTLGTMLPVWNCIVASVASAVLRLPVNQMSKTSVKVDEPVNAKEAV